MAVIVVHHHFIEKDGTIGSGLMVCNLIIMCSVSGDGLSHVLAMTTVSAPPCNFDAELFTHYYKSLVMPKFC